MKILITGFDPFGGEKINPAYEAVKILPQEIKGAKIIKLEIPTVFSKGALCIREAILKHSPNAVIAVGQAGGRHNITIEKVAINLKEARIKDNEGNCPIDEKIQIDGETAYFSTLPIKAMVKNINDHSIPAALSFTAGTYVCNDVMYNLLYMLNSEFKGILGGFIHVPYLTAQAVDKAGVVPSMSLNDISMALQYAIEAVIDNGEDINTSMGTTH